MVDHKRLCYFTYGTSSGHYHYALNLLQGIHEEDPDLKIDVFYAGTDEKEHFPEFVSEYHFIYTGYDSKLLMILRTLLLQIRFCLYLISQRPDVAHANTQLRTQWYTVYTTLLLKAANVPMIRTVHEQTDSRLGEVSAFAQQLAEIHFRLSTHLIVHTESLKNDILDSQINTPVSVIVHGNYLFFRDHINDKKEDPFVNSREPIVLFFGVKAHKGIGIFLEAIPLTESPISPWVVGPINDGDEKYSKKAEESEAIRTDLGFIPDADLWRYFHFADIVVMPYTEGTTSGALHIALAFECAVITSELPCFTEYIQHSESAIVLSETTPASLADAIDFLAKNEQERKRIAKAGLELERSDRFDWAKIGKETLSLYKGIWNNG